MMPREFSADPDNPRSAADLFEFECGSPTCPAGDIRVRSHTHWARTDGRPLVFGRDRDPLLMGDPAAKVEVRRAGWRKASKKYYRRKHVDQGTMW